MTRREHKPEQQEQRPPEPRGINTGGGAYIGGDVYVKGGDFVGRDRVASETEPARRPVPRARPALPVTSDLVSLLASALHARRLLFVWGEVPFPPAARPPRHSARAVDRWREQARSLPPPAFPLPMACLPACSILNLDPSGRLEAAMRDAGLDPKVIRGRRDVVAPGRHNLLLLGGDLARGERLLLSWDDVRGAHSRPDVAHLLAEAGQVAEDGVVLVVVPGSDPAPDPGLASGQALVRLWHELIAPHVGASLHQLVIGADPDSSWSAPLRTVAVDLEAVVAAWEETRPPAGEPPGGSLPRVADQAVHHKLDRLLAGQQALLRGQEEGRRRVVEEVVAALAAARMEDESTAEALQRALDTIQASLADLQSRQLPELDAGIRSALDEVMEVLGAGVDVKTGLELTVPLVPMILEYKTNLDLGSGIDLRQAWENLVAWTKKRSDEGRGDEDETENESEETS